jgi:phosphopantetheinyl transferase
MDQLASGVLGVGRGCVFRLRREDRTERAALATIPADDFEAEREAAERSFGGEERAYWQRDLAPRRRRSFLLGRVAARRALRLLGPGPEADRGIGCGVFGQPVVYGGGGYAVSIAHSEALAAAVAFPAGHPLAIDLELLQRDNLEAVQTVLTPEELALVKDLAPGDAAREQRLSFALWSAREALSKVLGCGFMCSAHLLAVKTLEGDAAGGWRGEFRHLGQWAFEVVANGEHMLALVRPKRTTLEWD